MASGKERPVPAEEIYDTYKLVPLIQKAVIEDSKGWRETYAGSADKKKRIYEGIWGEGLTVEKTVSPSIAANCLRWVGYDTLGYIGAERTFEQEIALLLGSAAHKYIEMKLKMFGKTEVPILHEETGLSGRVDLLIENPKTREWQAIDFKFVGNYGFQQVKREKLAPELKNTKGIYNASPETRLQLLQYIWILREGGKNVTLGNVIYINKDNGKTKECLVPWDAKAQYDMAEFLKKLKQARVDIKNGDVPEPTVQSTHICAGFCPHRTRCDYGQKFAAGRVRRQNKRRPNWVYKKAREQHREREALMIRLGQIQPRLFSDIDESDKSPRDAFDK